MIKRAIVFIFVFGLVLSLAPKDAFGQTYTGIVSIDSVKVKPGQKFSVNIDLESNNADISAILIPLKFDKTYLSVDSVSFVNTIMPADIKGYVNNDLNSGMVQITFLAEAVSPFPFYSGTGGKLAEVYFSLSNTAASQLLKIDTVYEGIDVGSGIIAWKRLEISDKTGITTYLPEFKAGIVNVELVTAVDDETEINLPTEYALSQNYPNPFNPTTTIDFSLPKAGEVKLMVYNILGQKVSTLVNGHYNAGTHSIEFDGRNHPSGIYFYRLEHDFGVETKKMAMVK